MAAAAGGGFKLASANVWAVLADEDPDDSEAAVCEAQSRAGVTHGRSEKARKEPSGKQRKKKQQPVAVANGEAAKTDVVVNGEQQKKRTPSAPAPAPAPAAVSKQAEEEATDDDGSDDESDGEEESSNSCRTVVGRLLQAAVAAVLIAFWVHAVAAPPHTATSP